MYFCLDRQLSHVLGSVSLVAFCCFICVIWILIKSVDLCFSEKEGSEGEEEGSESDNGANRHQPSGRQGVPLQVRYHLPTRSWRRQTFRYRISYGRRKVKIKTMSLCSNFSFAVLLS